MLGAVSLDEFLEQDDLFSKGAVAGVEGPKDFFNGMHEEVTDTLFFG